MELTPREAEVATLVADAHRPREICDRLGFSHNALTAHTKRIVRKYGLDPSKQARVQIALVRAGFLKIEPSIAADARVTPRARVLSPRTRFTVLERDGFRCRYCGRGADVVVLHVDHILPKSAGGSDDEGNLATSCKECNLGKGARVLGV